MRRLRDHGALEHVDAVAIHGFPLDWNHWQINDWPQKIDEIKAVTPGANDGPVCNITLLLTTGSRHPYKIDGRYLGKRNVVVPEQTESGQPDPFSISIYTLKELILREWRSDWEAKPASPSSIRLIHFGKLLDDKEPLKSM
jgi:hypothetical protein